MVHRHRYGPARRLRLWLAPLRHAPLLLCVACLASPARASTANDSPPPDKAAILRELDKLTQKGADVRATTHQQRLNLLQEAEASGSAASRLFEEALKAVEFEGRRDQTPAAWKNRQGDFLRSPQFQKAVQLHARYLSLSLRRAHYAGDPAAEDHATLSWNYARDLAATLAHRDFADGLHPASSSLLFDPVGSGLLARWLMVEQDLPATESWEPRPGALEGVLDTNIRPVWRKSRDARLLASWDLQLEAGKHSATDKQSTRQAEIFTRTIKPTLLFQRAQDLALLGQPNRATRETLELLREHPAHPDAPRWTDQLRRWLGTEADAASAPERSPQD